MAFSVCTNCLSSFPPCTGQKWKILQNHIAEVIRSKPRRRVYRGKRHIPPLFLGLFGAIDVSYPKGLNRLFTPCKTIISSN